ncbi:restriction endonuclease subunit S [Vibrio vulnificus]|nr:restriction endonuclease subunit S [Vibrio vulnificus]EME0077304.1 restriction endonuclease subunit S [Vibrio vulnificus]MCU8365267.1 restriction endonuclease subunit S [Vibrio vulnificus]MCU8369439.1 restriction endonuclease subunit S [Vibrio vulnificus]
MSESRWSIPESWEWVSVNEIAKVVGGGTPSSKVEENFTLDGIPWITPADLTGYTGTYISRGRRDLSDTGYSSCSATLIPAGSVLFSSRAPIGYCVVAGNEVSTNQGFKSLILEEGIVPEFIRYYLLSAKDYAESKASGTTFLELSGKRVGELVVPIAPLREQKSIVAKLDNLTEQISRARRELNYIPELIDKNKAAILKAAFEHVDGYETNIRELAEFVTSGSRGWAKYYSDDGSLFLRVGDTKRGSISLDLSDKQKVTPPKGSEGTRTRVNDGDILVTITADLGRVAVIPEGLGEAYVNQHMALIRLQSPELANYIAWFLVSPEGQARLHENKRGATRAGLGLDDIRDLRITLPSPEKREEIVHHIENSFDRLDRVINDHMAATNLLSRLYETVLSRAFRGELLPQCKSDDAASLLLNQIKRARDTKLINVKQKRTKRKPMTIPPKVRILQDSESWPEKGLPFEEVAKRNTMPYESIRESIFSLLAEEKPKIRQVFDTQSGCMHLKKVKS